MSVKLPISGTPVNVDFDPEAIRARYAHEREVRLRRETLEQFQGLSADLEIDNSDPWSEPIERVSIEEDLEAVVLGGGFGGLLAGAYLTKQGITDFRIVEQGGDFGGTWYWNRYPGVQCDVESFVYLPLLEETGYLPSQRYADGSEIFEHAQRIGRHFDLYRTALFQTQVESVIWSEQDNRWNIQTNRGDVLTARFVLRANGPLNKPQVPRVPGINDFKGAIFHTSRWDFDYTGGNAAGGLDNLSDKRVAIIGTGATGVQAVPHLARDAKELYVVQRTPTVVGPRDNRPTDPQWAASLRLGWQEHRHDNFLGFLNGHPRDEDLVDDIWTQLFPSLPGHHLVDVPATDLPVEDQVALAEISDMKLMQNIHARIDREVTDPETAEKLKPWFGFVCKRPAFNDDYLAAFNKDSVHLLAAPTGVDGITETGLVVDGQHYEVDAIIFATGFETGSTPSERYGYDIVGRDGLSMREEFADGAKTLHGFFSHGFPNFVELGLSQNAYVVNFTYMLDRKARHAARMIAHASNNGIAQLEPTLDAQNAWVEATQRTEELRLAYFALCTPGYYNGQGDVSRGFFNDVHNISEIDFWNMIDRWWQDGTFEGLTLKSLSAPTH